VCYFTWLIIAGMNDVLPKPFTKEGMQRILEKHLAHLKSAYTPSSAAPTPTTSFPTPNSATGNLSVNMSHMPGTQSRKEEPSPGPSPGSAWQSPLASTPPTNHVIHGREPVKQQHAMYSQPGVGPYGMPKPGFGPLVFQQPGSLNVRGPVPQLHGPQALGMHHGVVPELHDGGGKRPDKRARFSAHGSDEYRS
jgi:hypothetical protein